MSWLWIFLCVMLFISGLAILLWQRVENAHQLVAMRKLRGSDLYAALYPVLESALEKGIDEIRIEKDSVTFMGIVPPGMSGLFDFASEGYRCLDSYRLKTLTQLIALDAQDLQSEKYFALHKYKVMRPNGEIDKAYVYSARAGYRQMVRRRMGQTESERVY